MRHPRLVRHRLATCAAVIILSAASGLAAFARAAAPQRSVDAPEGSGAIAAMAREVLATADHRGLPFAIVDKRAALIAVYGGGGALAGASAVLLGQDPGDQSAPGVGARAQTGRLRPGDRTTAAGRYLSEPGRNRAGETVVWLDFGAALAIHRLRPQPAGLERARRLASGRAEDRRVSAGCVVVPVAFFEAVVQPLLGRGPAVVYILAESNERTVDGPAQAP
jgi:hypothetical protein